MTDCTVTLALNRPGAALFVVLPEVAAAGLPASGRTSGQERGHSPERLLPSFRGRRRCYPVRTPARTRIVKRPRRHGGNSGPRVRRYSSRTRRDSPAVKLRLTQVTAHIKGGLVHLESTPEETELPFALILAENTILSTANREDPLFRLDGRDQLDELGNKVQWEGRRVAYDRIKTYRRDEIAKAGATPRIYNRADWASAFSQR